MGDNFLGLVLLTVFVAMWVRFIGNFYRLRSLKKNVAAHLQQNRPTAEIIDNDSRLLTVRGNHGVRQIEWKDLQKLVTKIPLATAVDSWLEAPPPQDAPKQEAQTGVPATPVQKPLEAVSLEKVEKDTPLPATMQCEQCQKILRQVYYEVKGRIHCETCVETRKRELAGRTPPKRFFRAFGFGAVVGLICTFIYYGISALTGFEFGLIAVIVGLAVGFAVRHGADERGGWVYQGLAMFITYTSIALTYSPHIGRALVDAAKNDPQQTQSSAAAPAAISKQNEAAKNQKASKDLLPDNQETKPVKAPTHTELKPISALPAGPQNPASTPAAQAQNAENQPVPPEEFSWGKFFLGTLLILLLFWLAPFLAGLKNIMGLLIIGIAIYEAWKINKKSDDLFKGPFTIQTPAASSPTAS